MLSSPGGLQMGNKRVLSAAWLFVACAVGLGATPVFADEPATPTIDCNADPVTIDPGGIATITTKAVSPQHRSLTYSYSASEGHVSGSGSSVTFDGTDVPPGLITITCTVKDDEGRTASSSTNVTVTRG